MHSELKPEQGMWTGGNETVKPTAVFDKSLLQGIYDLSQEGQEECLGLLDQRYRLVVTVVLIEEVLVNYFEAIPSANGLPARQLEVIRGLYPSWMESPLELIFRQLVLKEDCLNVGMSPEMAAMFRQAVENPDALMPEATRWVTLRKIEKDERLRARIERQKQRRTPAMRCPDLLSFMEAGISHLCYEIDRSLEHRLQRLNLYLGRNLKQRHPESLDLIERAFSEASVHALNGMPFTRDYLLTEVLYDLAPNCQFGPNEFGHWTKVLRGKQINDEDDQQYLAAALACDRLLTCDEGMHRLADLFVQSGRWEGKAILIPRRDIRQLADFLS